MPDRLRKKLLPVLLVVSFSGGKTTAQVMKLKEVVNLAIENYPLIQAKRSYVNASKAAVEQTKRDYLPNVSVAAQQDYGTVNGQNGPLYGFGGLGTASSGPALPSQNWNSAFGALYLSNVNWDFFAFGRVKQRVNVARAIQERDQLDLDQELFQQKVRVSAAYLNLLAAKRLTLTQQRNLGRAVTFKNTAVVRAANGLIAGVDSSLAAAEVSNARISLNRAIEFEQEQANRLALLLGKEATDISPDTASFSRLPVKFYENRLLAENEHPLLKFYRQRVQVSESQENYFRKFYYPTFSLFGVAQGRGSGFSDHYVLDQSAFTRNYFTGVNPVRGNYLLGIGVSWNLTSILRSGSQVRSQKFTTEGLRHEYELADVQLKGQLDLADKRIRTSMASYAEAPVQVKAASDAYLQKTTLYRNGLTTLVDLTQTLYTLNRAETDRDIAYTNVWQALLLKSAALGDFSIFIDEF
ncbi:TolC family protein [Hufsiella ginkgonis]|uniref:TolC family protein n=1 Tax=Hufsiella ginkgonis TaxID=2695274 RepID=A0A7K1XU87_9SPHI|nr:TolC family protein [Hufsiella ginkgonis]MXV14554.1 TolC family protein [Hufsiella ginkgonis]